MWTAGDFDELLREGRTLQQRLRQSRSKSRVNNLTRSFDLLLEKDSSSGVLELNARADPSDVNSKSVLEVLKSKHPPP